MPKLYLALPLAAAAALAGCGADVSSGDSEQTAETALYALADDSEDSSQQTTAVQQSTADAAVTAKESPRLLSDTEDICLTDTGGENYTFLYGTEQYTAIYTPDNWKIIDSYKIRNKPDMIIICEALIAVHPIHGRDYESWRTAEDCAYEWEQHNIAYDMLPETSKWRANTKDVDINPEDQGKSFLDMASDRLRKNNVQ